MKTILITGSSSGIGKSIVEYFSKYPEWNIIATVRNVEKSQYLKNLPNVTLLPLDVTNQDSIYKCIEDSILIFGKIDVLVNNAGYGAIGVFEKATAEQIKSQFETNVFGVMNCIRAILPHFRENKSGTIINISSIGGLITFPMYSVYHGTKWAMEGFSESLAFELKPLNIKIKCVEPGAIKTDFYGRSMVTFNNDSITDYDEYQNMVLNNLNKAGSTAPLPELVAKVVYQAANDKSNKLRYPVGIDSKVLIIIRKILPISWFAGLVRMVIERKE